MMMMTDDSSCDTLDFHIERYHAGYQRGCYRIAAGGLSVHLDDPAQTFDLDVLSANGCSLRAPSDMFAVGRILNGDLYIGNTRYLANLRLKVIRHVADNIIACGFSALNSRQEIMLDRLLLEMQKRDITIHAKREKKEKNS